MDTNALAAYIDGDSQAIKVASKAFDLAIPVIVAGEFAFGALRSRYREAYEGYLLDMLERCTILTIDLSTSRHYASIRLELKQAGTPIPANDAWIAALSRQHAMPVMSRDQHFDSVGGLRRLSW